MNIKSIGKKNELDKVFRSAVDCHICFEQNIVEPVSDNIAQPRWIGPSYFESQLRILILLTNPGSGKGCRKNYTNNDKNPLKEYKDGLSEIWKYIKYQRRDMEKWGNGKFLRYFEEGLLLNFDEIALGNIAWCPTNNNKYPIKMLKQCFELHTDKLISILEPSVIILSGSCTHKFEQQVRNKTLEIIKTLHYHHRKGHEVTKHELSKINARLNQIRKQSTIFK